MANISVQCALGMEKIDTRCNEEHLSIGKRKKVNCRCVKKGQRCLAKQSDQQTWLRIDTIFFFLKNGGSGAWSLQVLQITYFCFPI